jgi:hypothetical protein
MEICSEYFKGKYYEEFMAQLRKMVYEYQGIIMEFMNYVLNQV